MIAFIVRQSIRYPGVIVALAVTLIIYGLYVLTRANLDVFPEFSPSQVVIQTEAPGLSAELVERQVTQPIENALAGASGVEIVRSQSIPGLSVVHVVFRDGSDVYRNRQVVGERLSVLASQLPAGVEQPTMTPLTSSASTVLGVGLTSKQRSLMDIRTLVDWAVRPHLMAVEGVADVNVFGGEVRQWQIQADPDQLLRHGLALEDLVEAARKASGVRSAGFIKTPNQHIFINIEGQPGSAGELSRALLAYREGQALRLGDVAKVTEAPAPSISAAAINGVPGVFLMIQGQLGANTRAVTLDLEQALEEIEPLLDAEKVELHPKLFRPANFIETAVQNVQRDLIIGSTLVIVVLFLFLFNYRTAFICTTAIPTSLLSAVIVLDFFGVGLNIMILGGLAIALGEVVDDAIIDTENIFRRLRENRAATSAQTDRRSCAGGLGRGAHLRGLRHLYRGTRVRAPAHARRGRRQAVRAARPGLHPGDPGFSGGGAHADPGVVQPAARQQRAEKRGSARCGLAETALPRLLERIERFPGRVVSAVFVVIACGIGLLPLFAGEFIPALREGHYIVHVTAVPGTAESESLRLGQRVAQAIGSIDGVQSVAQWVGRAPGGADTFGTHYSEYEVEIGALRGKEQQRILREIRNTLSGERGYQFPGVTFAVNTFLTERIEETITGFAAPLVINLYGTDLDLLDRDAQAVAAAVSGVRGARDVQLQAPPGTPELTIRLRHERLAALGLQPLAVMQAIQAAYGGATVGQVYEGSRVVDLVVVLDPAIRNEVTRVGSLRLRAADGRLVPLRSVADVSLTAGRYKILHAGGRRLQTVTASFEGRDLQSFDAEVERKVAEQVRLSPGNYLVYAGTGRAQAQAREELIVHSVIAGIGIFLLLYIAFGNLRNLAITFLNLPFALIGGICAVLFATGGWLSLGSLVGFVTLFGITLRNSIMLVSHYQYLVDMEGMQWGLETALRGAAERLPVHPHDRPGHGAGPAAARTGDRRAGARNRRSDGHHHRGRAGDLDDPESAGLADDSAALREVRAAHA